MGKCPWQSMALLVFALFFSSEAVEMTLLNQVRHSLKQIKPFKVGFVQQVYMEGELEIQESGEILFKDSTCLKWTYMDPDFKVFILIDNLYRFYDRENNQLMKGKIAGKNQRWIWQLLFADEISEYITCYDRGKMISIDSEKEELNFRIYIGSNGLPERVIQHDVSGVKYEYHFKNYQANVKLSDRDFDLTLPDDVEIVDGNLD